MKKRHVICYLIDKNSAKFDYAICDSDENVEFNAKFIDRIHAEIGMYETEIFTPLPTRDKCLEYIDIINILIKFDRMPMDFNNISYVDIILDEMRETEGYHFFIRKKFEEAIKSNPDAAALNSFYILIRAISKSNEKSFYETAVKNGYPYSMEQYLKDQYNKF